MKANCSSCIHNRGGCRNRDEDGLPFCNWEFDYERLDRRDPANWPDDSDFDEEEADMPKDNDVFDELRNYIGAVQNDLNDARKFADRQFSRVECSELRSIFRSIDDLLDEAFDEVDALQDEMREDGQLQEEDEE